MSFKVQVGPPQISIHQGHTVLISEQDEQSSTSLLARGRTDCLRVTYA
jgi:hypothetical protein